jgi:hypothetical protein
VGPHRPGRKARGPFHSHSDINNEVKYLPQTTNDSRRRCLFVVIDRAERRVFQIEAGKSAHATRAFP